MKRKPWKIFWIILGFICLGIGCIGAVLPFLPAFPFFLCTAICFAKSSERLHQWFIGTKLYEEHLRTYVEKRGMLLKTKISIILSLTLVMGIGFLMMSKVPIARICLLIIWLVHMIYFIWGVKTISPEKRERL